MIISSIVFLQVPLDRAHTNIIGDVQSVNGVIHALSAMAVTSQSIRFTPNISVKVTNDNFTLPISIAQYDLTNGEYNYAIVYVIENGIESLRYYFVPNYISLFDGGTKQSSLLFEFDEYLNNYDEILTAEKQLTERSHIIDTISVDDKYYFSNEVFPKQVPLQERDIYQINAYKRTAIGIEKNERVINNRFVILWERIFTDGAWKGTDDTLEINPLYKLNETTPVLFNLFRVIDLSTMRDFDGTVSTDIDGIDLGGCVNAIDNILNVDVTAYPPFPYTISYNENTNTLNIIIAQYVKADVIRNSNGSPYYISDKALEVPKSVIYSLSSIAYNKKITHWTWLFLPKISYEKMMVSDIGFPNVWYEFPNFKWILYANGRKMELAPIVDTLAIRFSVDVSTVVPQCRYEFLDSNTEYYKNAIYTSPVFPLENTGSLPTSISQYEVFQRSQSNQIIAKSNAMNRGTFLNLVKTSLSPSGTNVAMGGLNTIENELTYYETLNAKIADIRNAADDYNIPSAYSQGALLQDYLYLRLAIPISRDEAKAMEQNINEYGYEEPRYIKPLQQLCDCWDYIRTRGCSLPQIGNLRQRKVCEEMFNRGTTKWNFNHNSFTTDYLSCILKMRKESTNRIKGELLT